MNGLDDISEVLTKFTELTKQRLPKTSIWSNYFLFKSVIFNFF